MGKYTFDLESADDEIRVITMVMNDRFHKLVRIGISIIDILPIYIVIVRLGKSTIQIMLGLYWHGWLHDEG